MKQIPPSLSLQAHLMQRRETHLMPVDASADLGGGSIPTEQTKNITVTFHLQMQTLFPHSLFSFFFLQDINSKDIKI